MLQTVDESQHSGASPSRAGAVNVHVNARAAQEAQYTQQLHQIQKMELALEKHQDHLQKLQMVLAPEDEEKKALVEQRAREYAADPRSIAPEDALDTIVRLENHLKLQQRQNAIQTKELQRDRRIVRDRRNLLHGLESKKAEVLKVTGWDGKTLQTREDQDDMRDRVDEMVALAKRLREEHRAAQLIIHKKEHVVQFLHAELERRNEQREQLDEKFNAIRVADRDNREQAKKIDAITLQSEAQDNMLVAARDAQDTVAVTCLEEDVGFLRDQLKAKKAKRLEQDRVMRAQADRIAQLTTRFEVLGGALRDLGLDRAAAKALAAMPPGVDGTGNPDDMERIAPSDEQVPTAMYELLVRDMASIRSAVARKDVMVVEKQCVQQAMKEKLDEYEANLRYAQAQEAHTKDDKFLEMEHLRKTLEEQHRHYRCEIDTILHENLKLQADASKKRRGGH